MRDTLISVAGGTGGSVFVCLTNAEWVGQVTIGAIIGTVVSFFLTKLFISIFKYFFNDTNSKHTRKRRD
jgi:hypothetical protein